MLSEGHTVATEPHAVVLPGNLPFRWNGFFTPEAVAIAGEAQSGRFPVGLARISNLYYGVRALHLPGNSLRKRRPFGTSTAAFVRPSTTAT